MKYCEETSVGSVQSWESACLFEKLSTMVGFVCVSNLSVPQEIPRNVHAPVPQVVAFPGKGVAVGTENEERKSPESNRRQDGYNPNYDRVHCYYNP